MKVDIHDEIRRLQEDYTARRDEIRRRLSDFNAVPRERFFYELGYCILTPQSNALHCLAAMNALEQAGFQHADLDPEPFLGPRPTGYVRFHKTKARRLIGMKTIFPQVLERIDRISDDKELRTELVGLVNGLGYKEASHFLRNVGRFGVTILDRHIIRNFLRLDVLKEKPANISPRRYLELEAAFESLAARANIPAPELDLLLWSRETGFVLK